MVKATLLGHGIGGPLDLPVPLTYFALIGAMVLVALFAALSVLWPYPRLPDGPMPPQPLFRPPHRLLETLGVLGLGLVIVAGISTLFRGTDATGSRNIAPLLLWVVFWASLPLLGVALGNLYSVLNPWRTLAQWLSLGGGEEPIWERRLGLWPAAALLTTCSWFELIHPGASRPGAVGLGAVLYSVFLLTMMRRLGRETTLAVFDVFTPLNRLASAISPFGRDAEGRVFRRGWLRALPVVPSWPGLSAFVVAMIGIVAFDGLSYSSWWETKTGLWTSSTAVRTLLLLGSIALIGAIYRGFGDVIARLGGADRTPAGVAQRYAITLVPLAMSFFFAHYFTLVIFEGQQLISAISDPLGLGWDLFGTRNYKINFFLAPTTVWYLQIAGLLSGSAATLILGHDRTLAEFGGDARIRLAHLTLTLLLGAIGFFVVAG